MSLNSSCRAGTIEFQRQPRLSKEAIAEIKYAKGYEGFCERYGDYYLNGYRLGADTGILMSASGHSREQIDKYGITATLTVLFASTSEPWEKDFIKFTAGRQTQLLGYDTLDGKNWKRNSAANNYIVDDHLLRADTHEIMTLSENLLERVGEILERHHCRNKESLTFDQCEELVAEEIVVELLLEPMWRLRDVIQWRSNSNII